MIDGVRVIDFHGHVGANDIMGMVDDPDLMLHTMDSCGIDVSCVFNIYYPDGTTGNDMTARFVARHPDRFVGFAYVCPLMPADSMVAELERAIDTLGLVAIKLYPSLRSLVPGTSHLGPHLRVRQRAGTGPHPSHRYRVAGLSQVPGRRGAPLPQGQIRLGALGEHPSGTGAGHRRGPGQRQRLPGDLLHFPDAGSRRATGGGRGSRPGSLRLGHAPDGSPPSTGENHHGPDLRRGQAPGPRRKRRPNPGDLRPGSPISGRPRPTRPETQRRRAIGGGPPILGDRNR